MRPRTRTLTAGLLSSCTLALALAIPASGRASEAATTTTASPPGETTSVPAPTTAPGEPAQTVPQPAPAATAPEAPPPTPQVQTGHAQGTTPGAAAGKAGAHRAKGTGPSGTAGAEAGESAAALTRAGRRAVAPSALTPSLPPGLGSISGVPSFFIESFGIPPFLLPIFQAAGTAYGIPWQVLAAINQVETDYGRDLSVSSAGAEGWMQFLPAEWAQYGVDANGAGYKDPYNPADAIFAAARYLRAAGGDQNIRAAVFSYNHSQAYVESVMLRAQLLGGTPSELLGAITDLTEARFPVHAAAHFSDGFQTLAGHGSAAPQSLVGTTIYAQSGAPVIAVQDGEVVQVGESPELGRFVSLRDAFGNTYVYAELGEVAPLYPVLEARVKSAVSARISNPAPAGEPAPSGPATAGVQPRSPMSEGATVSALAFGAAASLEGAATSARAAARPPRPPAPTAGVRQFSEGPDEVYLHPLHAGVQVLAGTVLGHVGATAGNEALGVDGGPHILFQIRPAGEGAPLIDPKPILDGWVALENTSIFRAKGENPFLATSPTVGQVLLESQSQLEPQVLHDAGIQLGVCGRQDVQTGRVDKRVLAMLEYLSVSGLRPTVAGLPCSATATVASAATFAADSGESVQITAVNGIPVAGHEGPGTVADTVVRKLLMLQGITRPQRIVSQMDYPGAVGAVTRASADAIAVTYEAPAGGPAHAAGLFDSSLSPSQWIRLIARLGEIPDPTVASGPSPAAIPDAPGAAGAGGESEANGND